jgi:hypothetical protein
MEHQEGARANAKENKPDTQDRNLWCIGSGGNAREPFDKTLAGGLRAGSAAPAHYMEAAPFIGCAGFRHDWLASCLQ